MMDAHEMLRGDVQVTQGDNASDDGINKTATTNPFKDMFDEVYSSFVAKSDGIALIPSPNAAPVMKVVTLNGREVPYIRSVQAAPNRVPGWGVMGYIDVDATPTDEGDLITTAADI